jgi:hypothetical protein
MTGLELQVVEKSPQVLGMILHGPGLERLVAQKLTPEIVQQTTVVATEY